MQDELEQENLGITEVPSHTNTATKSAPVADYGDTTTPIPSNAVKILHSPAPIGAAYHLNAVNRTLRRTLLIGGTVNSRFTFDGVEKAVPVVLFNTVPVPSAAGPGATEGILQVTARFQVGNSRFVRVTGYGPDADTLLEAIKKCHNSNLEYLRKTQELREKNTSPEETRRQLDALPKRVLYFDMAGEWRPDIRRGFGAANQPPQTHILRSEMSIKLAELACMWSDGSVEQLLTFGDQPAANRAPAMELGSEL